MRQDEDKFTEQSFEDVRLHSNSYRQNLSLDPIASHFLNLETSDTRLGWVLLVAPSLMVVTSCHKLSLLFGNSCCVGGDSKASGQVANRKQAMNMKLM